MLTKKEKEGAASTSLHNTAPPANPAMDPGRCRSRTALKHCLHGPGRNLHDGTGNDGAVSAGTPDPKWINLGGDRPVGMDDHGST